MSLHLRTDAALVSSHPPLANAAVEMVGSEPSGLRRSSLPPTAYARPLVLT